VRTLLAIATTTALLCACTAPAGAPPPPTAPVTTTITAPPGKIETFAAAVIGQRNAGSGQGYGLTTSDTSLLESTNTPGTAGIRALDPTTGTTRTRLLDQPGLTASGIGVSSRSGTAATVWQLTLHNGIAIARDPITLAPRRQISYQGEGRGLCDDGTQLVHSNGSMRLTLRDATTFAPTGTIDVTGGWWANARLGELECVADDGRRVAWANLMGTSWMLRVDLDARAVTAVADLAPAMTAASATGADASINGIAAIPNSHNEFWVTGAGWPTVLRIRLTPRP
jgi:glutamine cyclotransferase